MSVPPFLDRVEALGLFFGGFRLRLDFATRGHVGLHENNFF